MRTSVCALSSNPVITTKVVVLQFEADFLFKAIINARRYDLSTTFDYSLNFFYSLAIVIFLVIFQISLLLFPYNRLFRSWKPYRAWINDTGIQINSARKRKLLIIKIMHSRNLLCKYFSEVMNRLCGLWAVALVAWN